MALAAGLGTFLVARPEKSTAPETPRAPDASAGPVAATPPRADAAVRPRATPQPAAAVAGASEPEIPPALMAPPALISRFRDARTRMIQAAAPCSKPGGQPAGDQAVSFQYRLVVEAGFARISDVETMSSSIDDFALQQCILDNVRRLRWATEGDDSSVPVQERLGLAELAPH